MKNWLLLLAGSMAAGALGAAVGFYATFPSSEAATYAAYSFHEANKDYALAIGDVRPWWLPGVKATDVVIYTVKRGKRTKDEPKPGYVRTEMAKLDSLGVRLQLLPRLMGKWSFGYTASLLGGDIDGSYATGDDGVDLDFTASGLDLSKMPIDKGDVVVHLGGTLGGKSDLVLDATDVKNSTGSIELTFDGLKLDEGSKVMGLTLPVVTFSTAKVRLEAKEGKLEVTDGTFDGDVLDMTLTGDISLNKKLARSRNRMELAVTLPEDLDKLAQIAPQLKRARDDEGAYHFNIGGTILSPTFRPGRGTGGKIAGGDGEEGMPRLSLPRGGASLGNDEAGDPDAAREERKKKREERIKERRERLKKRREEAANGGGRDDMGDDEPMLPPLQPVDEGDRRPLEERDDLEDDMGPGAARNQMPDLGPPNNGEPPDDGEEL